MKSRSISTFEYKFHAPGSQVLADSRAGEFAA
jgi:hypothetical protein